MSTHSPYHQCSRKEEHVGTSESQLFHLSISAILIVTINIRDYSVAAPGDKLQGEFNSVDGYGSLDPFGMYLKKAQEEDRKRTESWKAVASDTLIFVSRNTVIHHTLTQLLQSALFSAVVATLLAISTQNMQPDPQEKPTFYLENIYQVLADPNRTHVSTIPTHSDPTSFSPPKSAVWVNSLWLLSLLINLSCALLALLLQQWTR